MTLSDETETTLRLNFTGVVTRATRAFARSPSDDSSKGIRCRAIVVESARLSSMRLRHEEDIRRSCRGETGGRRPVLKRSGLAAVSYTHLRAHETGRNLVCRLLLEKK